MAGRPIEDWMWNRALTLLREAEQRSQQFFQRPRGTTSWQAPIDVFQLERELVVWVALPGVAADHIEVSLNGRHLSIGARRALVVEPTRAAIRRLEIPYGRFERIVDLGEGNFTIKDSRFADGCLRLRLHNE